MALHLLPAGGDTSAMSATLDQTSLTLQPQACSTVTLSVTTPDDSTPGTHASFRIEYDENTDDGVLVDVFHRIPDAQVSLVATQHLTVQRGASATLDATISHAGLSAHTYTLTLSDEATTQQMLVGEDIVVQGQSTEAVTLDLTDLTAELAPGDYTMLLQVHSVTNPDVADTVAITITVLPVKVYLPIIHR
ncbi:MAG: hypothetical protein HC837_20570 [Chloroflexaceae bacterium]|nr:hypothetical protein [Chloroflexaceae bacterium]